MNFGLTKWLVRRLSHSDLDVGKKETEVLSGTSQFFLFTLSPVSCPTPPGAAQKLEIEFKAATFFQFWAQVRVQAKPNGNVPTAGTATAGTATAGTATAGTGTATANAAQNYADINVIVDP